MDKETRLDVWNDEKKKISREIVQSDKKKKSTFNQKGIYWIEFGENLGFELSTSISKPRPALIVSDTRYNYGDMAIVVPLTSRQPKTNTQYRLYKSKYPKLISDSTVKLEQIRSMSSSRIKTKICDIDDNDWKSIRSRLKTIFNI